LRQPPSPVQKFLGLLIPHPLDFQSLPWLGGCIFSGITHYKKSLTYNNFPRYVLLITAHLEVKMSYTEKEIQRGGVLIRFAGRVG